MMLVVGLGNPGSEYAKTRHNVGFMVVERLAAEFAAGESCTGSGAVGAGSAGGGAAAPGGPAGTVRPAGGCLRWRLRCRALVAEGHFWGRKVILARPQTYMNNSGEAVAALLRWYGFGPAELLVICDDLDLPPGQIRIRKKGGDGGHRGLKSIIAALGTKEFPRLRIGIGRPEPEVDVVRWVLGRFNGWEAPVVDEGVARAVQAVRVILGEGIEKAMNLFN
ncbi:MAG: aminoacyl-tRNA hydrolase [Bacillota bacterium]